jgi:hypothetical protein
MIPRSPFVILLFLSSFLSCEKFLDPDPVYPKDSFYFNSFELSSDTTGWYGISMDNFVEDAPRVGGKYSIKISGGCVIPHAYYWIDTLTEDCSLVLKFWGKNLSNGGSVALQADDQSAGIHISVSELAWTGYFGEDTLHCTAGRRVRLGLYSGGIASSSMLVDQIEISKVEYR